MTVARIPNVPEGRFSRLEYQALLDQGVLGPADKVELIDGRVVPMSPEGSMHSASMGLTADALRRIFGDGFAVRVQNPLALDPDGEPEPDIAVVKGGHRRYARQHPTDAVIVVEVAESSLAEDRTTKARLYARAGILDYWIVNLVDRVVEVHRAPSANAYATVTTFGPEDSVAPLAAPDRPIQVADLLP